MKKYCLDLVGLDYYTRRKTMSSGVLQDIESFCKKINVLLTIQNNAILVGRRSMSIQQLETPLGKKQAFDWIMEKI